MDERQLSSPNLSGLEPFAFDPQRIEKPWGWELLWAHADTYVGKLLFIRAGQALSLQFHNEKDESWYVYEGRAQLEMGAPGDPLPASEVVGPGAAFRIRPGTIHRVAALEDTLILEVSTPHLEDIVRLEDRYGRIDSS
jgi:mannose-6-phosphate isomerase-like protein (cupin superfamily)